MASRPAELPALLASLTRGLRAAGLPFMLIGGQAVLVHGRPRLTEDIDLTLGVGPERLDDLLRACLLADLRVLPADPAAFVAETFVLPARHEPTGMRVDCIFSSTAYERAAIERAELIPVGGESVPVATAEDLLVHKLFAGRPRDVEDAEGVVRRKGAALDWAYLREAVDAFKEVPGCERLGQQLEALQRLID
jgi:predicted nucleotidyltransferase